MTTQHHTDKRQFGRAGAAMALAFLIMSASAAPTLTIDSVLQRYPWSNTVDIRYTVTGLDAGQKADMLFKARIDDGADVKAASERIPGNGSYTSQWIPASGLQTTNCTVGGVMAAAPLYEPGSYMIVDLATGAISYEDDDPSATAPKYNDDIAYKTTKMVLRKIPAASGVFLQQSTAKSFTFAHDYYIGIFPVTEDQYHMIRNVNAGALTDSYGSVTNGDGHKPLRWSLGQRKVRPADRGRVGICGKRRHLRLPAALFRGQLRRCARRAHKRLCMVQQRL